MAAKRSSTRTRARPGADVSAARRLPVTLLALALAGAGVWAYAPSFSGVLVLDDVRAIAQNPTIRTLWPLTTPLSPPGESTVSGRPVANLSFAFNYALAPHDAREVFGPGGRGAPRDADERFRRNIWGYHALNLLIHVAAALTLFGIARRTLATPDVRRRLGAPATGTAFVMALLWLVHPLQTAAVTYVVQRVESLVGLFYLLTLYCSIRAGGEQHRRLWTIGAVVSCALGMATKEVMVTAPVAVWLWYRVFSGERERPPRTVIVGLAACWMVFAMLVWHEHRGPSIDLSAGTMWRYLLTQAHVVVHYLRLTVWPWPLVFLYTWPLTTSIVTVVWPIVLLATLLILTGLGVVRRHPLGFAGAWFFLILAPTSSVIPIVTEVAAEHRMYLPLASPIACAVVAARVVGRRLAARISPQEPRARRTWVTFAATLTIAVVVVLTTLTQARNRDYWSAERLWQRTVGAQPQNQRARVAYGEALADAGRYADAEAQYTAAVELAPADPIARARLGGVLAAQGRLDEAVPHFERALRSRPDDIEANRALGLAYAVRQQDARAIPLLEQAIAAQPNDAFLLGQLAMILSESRDPSLRNAPRAVELAGRAVDATSRRDPEALEILSAALAAARQWPDAASAAAEALRLARLQGKSALAARLENRVAAYESLRQSGQR